MLIRNSELFSTIGMLYINLYVDIQTALMWDYERLPNGFMLSYSFFSSGNEVADELVNARSTLPVLRKALIEIVLRRSAKELRVFVGIQTM